MSKSLGNYIGINEPAREIFGKTMSVSDELMWRYYDLLSFKSAGEIAGLRQAVEQGQNPRNIKVELAQELVARFHGQTAAKEALAEFEARFRQGVLPDDMPRLTIDSDGKGLPLPQVLKQAGLTASTSDALRMIDQGGVRADGDKVSDKTLWLQAGTTVTLQVGKRKFARVDIR